MRVNVTFGVRFHFCILNIQTGKIILEIKRGMPCKYSICYHLSAVSEGMIKGKAIILMLLFALSNMLRYQ